MKRIMVLCLVMALLATMTIGVSATTTPVTPDEDGKYEVIINVGTGHEGDMYGFVAVPAGAAISEANIVYIDQANADADGNVKFTGFAPKDTYTNSEGVAVAWETCDLYIGGAGFAEAALKGTLAKAATSDPITISGTITDTFSSRVATITVLNGETVVGTTTANVADGTYSVEVEEGTYDVKFTKTAYLSFKYTGVEVGEDGVVVDLDMSALAGDVNESGGVNVYDLDAVLADYNKSTANLVEARSDLNESGSVNVYDLDALLAVYNQSAKTEIFTPAN